MEILFTCCPDSPRYVPSTMEVPLPELIPNEIRTVEASAATAAAAMVARMNNVFFMLSMRYVIGNDRTPFLGVDK